MNARLVLRSLLALALLNTLLSMKNWWPTPGVLPDARLAPEAVFGWVLLLAWVAWRGALSARALWAMTGVVLLFVLGRYFDVTVPALFGRPVNLYWDGQQIPTFLWVSARDYPWWVSVVFVGVLLAVLAVLLLAIRWAIGVAAREAAPAALRARWTWAVTALATLTVIVHLAQWAPSVTWHAVTHPVSPTYVRQAGLLANALLPGRVQRVLPPSNTIEQALAQPQQSLAALRGRDFKLIFLESYGAMAFEHPRAAPALARARARLAQDLQRSGHRVASAYVKAATFAGASELSHLSLLSGIDLTDPLRHDLLLTTDRPTLSHVFRAAGYETVGLYPALSWDWPESRFYGFDRFLDGRDLDWRGPALGYWKIPDQYSLVKFEALHPRSATALPRFLFFPTITTHLPFGPVPPYQPDWERLLSSDPYGAEESQRLLASFVDWVDMLPNYIGMFEWTYQWLGGWLQRPEPRESVILLVGDHQPAASVSGAGSNWDVPVHIVTRDPALIERFVALGFTPGLEPRRPVLGGMHDLTALLLRALAEPPPATALR
ncbi:MAG: sulfatase-like hydrolase/transferase [Betaproteobacteria bacterium]